MRPTEPSYDRGTVTLHWLTAALVTVLWLIGTFLEDLLPKGVLRSGVWSAHFDLGLVLAVVLVAFMAWRRTGGRRLPIEDAGPLHRVAKGPHAALYLLLLLIVALGIANAFVRGVHLIGPVDLPKLGDPEWRKPLTRWHGLAAHLLMALALFHSAAALAHHYLWHDAVLRRILAWRR
jgi:cytochrome b561